MREREKPIFGVLSEVTSIASLCAALRTVESEWRQIVGDSLSRRSSPASYEDGVLRVIVDCQTALHDMNFKKTSIAKAIYSRSMLRVNEIKAEIGNPSAAARSPCVHNKPIRTGKPKALKLDRAVTDEIASGIAAEHPDIAPELIEIISRCIAMSSG